MCCTLAPLSAQYVPPLDGPLLVTGTFGELRSDHYHGGIDFRAPIGTPVRAVADGYVSRVLVSGGGFGQAVYVDHPGGKRSVYGHLEVLAPELLDTIRSLQYAGETFAVNFLPDSTAFPVRQGQVIGGVGNRGYSFGPHLHFEWREQDTDAQLNPLVLGFPVPDTRRPNLRKLRVYSWGLDGHPTASQTFDLERAALPDTVRVTEPRLAFGFQAFDRQNGMPNRNGVYQARLQVDTATAFAVTFDRVPIEDTEYINALTDYREYQDTKAWYYLLYAATPRAVYWQDTLRAGGQLMLLPGGAVPVTVTVADYAGNVSEVKTVVKYEPPPVAGTAPAVTYQYYLPAGEPSIIDTAGMRLELDADALYDDLNFRYARLADGSDGYLSDTHQLQDGRTPLHGRATLYLRPRAPVADSLRPRVYIGRCGGDGQQQPVGGEWQPDGSMQARIGGFGNYALLLDTVPPEVAIRDFRTDLRNRGAFSLLITDVAGNGGLSYRATVDGKWVLMEYDAKSNTLTHRFDDTRVRIGGDRQHEFVLHVTDARGNESTFRRNFRR